jgi:hypothetical protein
MGFGGRDEYGPYGRCLLIAKTERPPPQNIPDFRSVRKGKAMLVAYGG